MRQATGQTPQRSRQGGFTLVELMITVAVAAILLMIAVPSFKNVISRTNLGSAHDALLSSMRYARTEAVSRGTTIAVAASSSGAWGDGWNVKPASSSTVLRSQDAIPARYTVSVAPTKSEVDFNPQGNANNEVCFTFTDTDASASAPKRYIKILPSGSIHTADSCS